MAVTVPGVSGLRRLGSGTFSVVYEGVQDAFGRAVAVKVINGRLDPRALERFRKECLAVGRVSRHPNIITVFDADVTPAGEPYLVMELFPNGSLAAVLQRQGPRPLEEVLRVGVTLCGALGTAHLAGVFHRDVKPENVLVGDGGEPVLADFGIAVAGGEEGTAELAFTAVHAAPEILIDQSGPTAAADVYSLGSTLYELLAGAPAFPVRAGEKRLVHCLRVASDPLPPIARGDVPTIAFAAIAAAMARVPEERPSLLELAERIGEVQDRLQHERTEPLVLRPDPAAGPGRDPDPWASTESDREDLGTVVLDRRKGPPEPPPAERRSRGLLLVGAAAGAAVLLVGAALVLSGGGNAPPTPPTPPGPTTPTAAAAPTTVAAQLIPTGVRVTATPTGRLEITWAAPAQGPPERYTIVYSNPGERAQAKDVTGTATAASVDGAAPTSCVRVVAIFRAPVGFTQGQSERACP